jgi:hypothetical protein
VDCQNLFCEVSKHARCGHPDVGGLAGRTRIKQKYRMDPRPLSYGYPPKWIINHHPRVRTRANMKRAVRHRRVSAVGQLNVSPETLWALREKST